jgi:hypothetical protein
MDGTNYMFNYSVIALQTNTSGAYSVQVIGFQAGGTGANQIALVIAGTSQITAGTYTEDGSTTNVASVNFVQAGSAYPYVSNNSNTNPVTVTVTSISSTSIQGTFKGDAFLLDSNGATTTKKVIANGQFSVNF